MWVETRGGTEAIVHTPTRLVEEKCHDRSYGMLQIGLKNAFNHVNHQGIFSVVRHEFPEVFSLREPELGESTNMDRRHHIQ